MGLNPNYLYDNSNVVWYGTETYNQALNALKTVTGKSDTAVETMLNAQYGAADYWAAVEALKDNGVVIAKNTNGYNCFAYANDVTMTAPTGPITSIDSNQTSTSLVRGAPTYDVTIDDVPSSPTYNKVLTNPMGSVLTPEHGFYGWKFFAGECIQAIQCAGVGITLGKMIDSALYNLNPDFWDANGMASINPETWSSLTNGDDSFAAGLFNTIYGINPNSGNAQMFMDENALAYMAYYMMANGVFAPPTAYIPDTDIFDGYTYDSNIPIYSGGKLFLTPNEYYKSVYGYSDIMCCTRTNNESSRILFTFASATSPFNCCYGQSTRANTPATCTPTSVAGSTFTYDNKTVYYHYVISGVKASGYSEPLPVIGGSSDEYMARLAWMMVYGSVSQTGVDGISNQPNATQPNISNWNDIPSTLSSLQSQYPDLWTDSVPNTILQPDGTTKTITYVPVATPNANGQWDTQPTSDTNNSSQASPQVQPQQEPTPENNDLLKLVLQLITMPEPQPDTQTQTQTQPNPDIPDMPSTGDGSSPTPTPASGSASALWAVYHPTQAQINSFGAWLWSSNFVDQLLKVFQNPMDAIISLHKVFVTPTDAGTTTIHAGYLDSNVSSAYVTQQYEYVDCGSVDCKEFFGTVFDYIGTNVSLYLPFIGIVPLNVDEVMRSTINVKYGCDLFTGAILVEVKINRDGNDVIMYQYGGDGGVQYPVSGSRSSGFLTGLAATIGAAASVATGGATLPAVAAAFGGSVMSAQKQVQHSGGFSGNSGAMGGKTPYLIIERPQIKTASTFPRLDGYPTNYSSRLGDLSGQVNVTSVHVEGINATDSELKEIESLLKSGVLV